MPETSEPKALKVLVADDEEVIANSLVAILTQAGYDRRAVFSGKTVIEMALSFTPSMLICEVVMAAVSGIGATIEVRAKLPAYKIFLSFGQEETWSLLEKARG